MWCKSTNRVPMCNNLKMAMTDHEDIVGSGLKFKTQFNCNYAKGCICIMLLLGYILSVHG